MYTNAPYHRPTLGKPPSHFRLAARASSDSSGHQSRCDRKSHGSTGPKLFHSGHSPSQPAA
eukprot:943150-Prymnesium_polylepis.1